MSFHSIVISYFELVRSVYANVLASLSEDDTLSWPWKLIKNTFIKIATSSANVEMPNGLSSTQVTNMSFVSFSLSHDRIDILWFSVFIKIKLFSGDLNGNFYNLQL